MFTVNFWIKIALPEGSDQNLVEGGSTSFFAYLPRISLYTSETGQFLCSSSYAVLAATVGHRTNSDKVAMCQVKYVICPDINEQVNPGSKIWLPNVRSILKLYCEHC